MTDAVLANARAALAYWESRNAPWRLRHRADELQARRSSERLQATSRYR